MKTIALQGFGVVLAAALLAGGALSARADEVEDAAAKVREHAKTYLATEDAASKKARDAILTIGIPALPTLYAILDETKNGLERWRLRTVIHFIVHGRKLPGWVKAQVDTLGSKSLTTNFFKNLERPYEHLHYETDVQVVLDPGLPAAEYANILGKPFELRKQDVGVETLVEEMCLQAGIDYDVRYGVVFLSSKDRIRKPVLAAVEAWKKEAGPADKRPWPTFGWEAPLDREDVADAKKKALVAQLREKKIDLDLTSKNWEQLLGIVQKEIGLPLKPDKEALAALPKESTKRINLRVKQVSLEDAISLVTKPFGLDWRLGEKGVEIGTAAAIAEKFRKP